MATEVRQRPVGDSADDTDKPAASSAAVTVDRSAAVAESCRRVSTFGAATQDMLVSVERLRSLRLQSAKR